MATTYSLAKKRPVHNILDGYKGTISTYIDFTDTSIFPTTGFTTGDTLEVCNIGKGCVITDIVLDRITAEANTIDVGYGGSAAYFFDDATLNGTTCLSTYTATAGNTLPLRFTANDTIDITGADGAITTAQCWLHVNYIRPTQEN